MKKMFGKYGKKFGMLDPKEMNRAKLKFFSFWD